MRNGRHFATIDKMSNFIGIAPIAADTATVKFQGRKLSFPDDRLAKTYKLLAGQYEWAVQRHGNAMPTRWLDRLKLGLANG